VAFLSFLGVQVSADRLGLLLPVGISFYTFQTLSYTIDVYRGNLKPIRSLLDFAVFVAFFPQLVAGPIVRASEFLPQLDVKRRFSAVTWRASSALFLFGYVKKACIADNFATVVDRIFSDPDSFGPMGKWLGLSLYSVQIYCDFSGYSDMAIAMAAFFGYRLTLNFDFPYVARSVTEFWRRWHISLSTWFRDYLYIPLGGNRQGALRTYRNLVIVFFLCGLWHGASWNFVIWGLFHGFFLVAERALRLRGPTLLAHVYTLAVAMLAWVFFRTADLPTALDYLGGLFGMGAPGTQSVDPIWWALLGLFAVVHVFMSRHWLERAIERMPSTVYAVLYGAAWALAFPWAAVDYKPFIYFQF
jgi:alginate O-acetyltransferase complex protein AlgI